MQDVSSLYTNCWHVEVEQLCILLFKMISKGEKVDATMKYFFFLA